MKKHLLGMLILAIGGVVVWLICTIDCMGAVTCR